DHEGRMRKTELTVGAHRDLVNFAGVRTPRTVGGDVLALHLVVGEPELGRIVVNRIGQRLTHTEPGRLEGPADLLDAADLNVGLVTRAVDTVDEVICVEIVIGDREVEQDDATT